MPEKTESKTLLLIEKDAPVRAFWEVTLKGEGFNVITAESPDQALETATRTQIDYVFLGTGLEGEQGIKTLLGLQERNKEIRVISPSNTAQVKELIQSSSDKAEVKVDHIRLSLTALEERRQAQEQTSHQLNRISCKSPAMKKVIEQISAALKTNTTVLLMGETGTGKGMFARVIHYNSNRSKGPFVEVSCTSLPENLLESELFGHEAGAFTDARARKLGLVEVAAGGTVFLDEIGDLPMPIQGKLLRLLEEKSYRRIGGVTDRKTDIRVIAATHRNLADKVKRNEFRDDLYYRISVFPITIPPFRERVEDIIPLAYEFMDQFRKEMGRRVERFSPAAEQLLLRYQWPGNIRELKNAIERAVLLCQGPVIDTADLLTITESRATITHPTTLPDIERQLLEETLAKAGGNQSRAARTLGISRYALRNRMRRYGLKSSGG